MDTTLNTAICVNGNNYQSEDSIPENIRQAFDRVVAYALKAKRSIFFPRSSALVVPTLNSRIVCDTAEFRTVADMPSAQRRAYEDALAAILPDYIVKHVAQGAVRLQQRNKLLVASTSLVASMGYVWFHGCLTDPKFLVHFIRFVLGLT